jgi:hypothetical protein
MRRPASRRSIASIWARTPGPEASASTSQALMAVGSILVIGAGSAARGTPPGSQNSTGSDSRARSVGVPTRMIGPATS